MIVIIHLFIDILLIRKVLSVAELAAPKIANFDLIQNDHENRIYVECSSYAILSDDVIRWSYTPCYLDDDCNIINGDKLEVLSLADEQIPIEQVLAKYNMNNTFKQFTFNFKPTNSCGYIECITQNEAGVESSGQFFLLTNDTKIGYPSQAHCLRNNNHKNHIEATIGEEVILKCSFSNLNLVKNSSHWEKDNNSFQNGVDIALEFNENKNNWFSVLKISKMRKEDVGWYKCVVRDSNGQLYTRSVYIKIIDLYSKRELILRPTGGINETISIHTGKRLIIGVEYATLYPDENISWSILHNSFSLDLKKNVFKQVDKKYIAGFLGIATTKTKSTFTIGSYSIKTPPLIMVTLSNSTSSAQLIFKIIVLEKPKVEIYSFINQTNSTNYLTVTSFSTSKVVNTFNYTTCTLHLENSNCNITRENTFQTSSLLDPTLYERFYELEIVKTLNMDIQNFRFEPRNHCSIIEVFAHNEYGNSTGQTQIFMDKKNAGLYDDLCHKMFCIRDLNDKEDINQELGSEVVLTCSSARCNNGTKHIPSWATKQDLPISEIPHISIEENETKDYTTSTLRIKYLNYSNRGAYSCNRKWYTNGVNLTVNVTVADKPYIIMSYHFKSSLTIVARCRAQSDSPVKFRWIYSECKQLSSKNSCGVTIGDPRQFSDEEFKAYDGFYSYGFVSDPEHDKKESITFDLTYDCTFIECYAENAKGNSSERYLIFRNRQFYGSELVCIQGYENNETIEKVPGDDLTLTCVVPKIFTFSVVIVWMKNWSILDDVYEDNDIFRDSNTSDVHLTVSLRLRNLTYEDTGLYLCQVDGFWDTKAEAVYKAVYLKVEGTPMIWKDKISSLFQPEQNEFYQTFFSSVMPIDTFYIPVLVRPEETLIISATIFGNYLLNISVIDFSYKSFNINNNFIKDNYFNEEHLNYSIIRSGNKIGLKKTNYTNGDIKEFELIYNNNNYFNNLSVLARFAIFLLDKPHVKLIIDKLENKTEVICESESSLRQNITLIHTKCKLNFEDNNCNIITTGTDSMPVTIPYENDVDTYMLKFEFHKIWKVEKFSLDIHCGIFECLATNDFGKDSNTKKFIINPDDSTTIIGNYDKTICIRGFGREVTRNIGEDFSMECSAVKFDSNWLTNMTWYKQDERVDDNLINKTETEHHYIVKLTLTNLKTEHKGLYRCVYNSSDGQFVKTLLLDVIDTSLFTYLCISAIGTTILCGVSAYFIFQNQKKRTILKKMGIEFFENGALDQINPDMSIAAQAEFLPYDKKYEIPKQNINLGIIIGAGEFGVVQKATLFSPYYSNQEKIVAVKTVTPSANNITIKTLTSELKIMIYLGKHLNIVQLFGAVTKDIIKRKLMIVVEYCEYGNLRNHIQNNKDHFVDQVDVETDQIDFNIFSKVSQQENITSEYIEESDTLLNTQEVAEGSPARFTTMTLLAWSFQIARGMNYLSSKRIIHGDLAARNVLLCEGNIIKICDFGLAKNLYKTEIYKRSNPTPLPFKWLALETMKEMIFSTYSDVWAFGVTLWELFSMGQLPYPEKDLSKLFTSLQSGYRMSKPCFANYELYKIMLKCWSEAPEDRPLFNELELFFANILPEDEKDRILSLSKAYEGTDKLVIENSSNPVVQYKFLYNDEENIEIIPKIS